MSFQRANFILLQIINIPLINHKNSLTLKMGFHQIPRWISSREMQPQTFQAIKRTKEKVRAREDKDLTGRLYQQMQFHSLNSFRLERTIQTLGGTIQWAPLLSLVSIIIQVKLLITKCGSRDMPPNTRWDHLTQTISRWISNRIRPLTRKAETVNLTYTRSISTICPMVKTGSKYWPIRRTNLKMCYHHRNIRPSKIKTNSKTSLWKTDKMCSNNQIR